MNDEDIKFVTNLGNILSFVDLQKIYETWEHDGSIMQKANLLNLGYVSLITHPAIFLTKDNACEELKAASVCHFMGKIRQRSYKGKDRWRRRKIVSCNKINRTSTTYISIR